jgi:prepilin-type N-terminal cleavage/methylation domain-containing protein
MTSSKGFSLTEVLIALVVLSVGLLSIGQLMLTSMRTTAYGNHFTQATALAQAKMEEFRSTRPLAGVGSDQCMGVNGTRYMRTWSIIANGEMRIITVVVDWVEKTNHSIRLSTILG